MPSPTFDSLTLFDSLDDVGGHFTEGFLGPLGYAKLRQKIHFEGENGDRYLMHGWNDREWEFKGIICAHTLADMWTIISNIQGYIDTSDESTFYTLVDSLGVTWTNAQILTMSTPDVRRSANVSAMNLRHFDGYMTELVVRGIMSGMQQEG